VAELAGRLGVVQALDAAVGPIKQRERGLTAGGLLLALAQTQMLGGTFWSVWIAAAPTRSAKRFRRCPPRRQPPRPGWPPGSARNR